MLAEVGPERVGLEAHEHDPAAVTRLVHTDQRIGHVIATEAGHAARLALVQLGGDDIRSELPHRQPEQRNIDDRGLAGLLAPEQRCADPSGDGQPAHHVAEGRPLPDRPPVVGRSQRRADTAPRPIRRTVVARLAGIGAPRALA